MKSYMRNQFEFFGLRAPRRMELVGSLIQIYGLPPEECFNNIIYELCELPERYYQSIALELQDQKVTGFKEEDIELLEYLIINKSWWDTVDWIAFRHTGLYFQQYPEYKLEITSEESLSTKYNSARNCIFGHLQSLLESKSIPFFLSNCVFNLNAVGTRQATIHNNTFSSR